MIVSERQKALSDLLSVDLVEFGLYFLLFLFFSSFFLTSLGTPNCILPLPMPMPGWNRNKAVHPGALERA